MYPAFIRACCALGHHGYQRAFELISAQASTGPFGSPVFACAGKTDPPSRLPPPIGERPSPAPRWQHPGAKPRVVPGNRRPAGGCRRPDGRRSLFCFRVMSRPMRVLAAPVRSTMKFPAGIVRKVPPVVSRPQMGAGEQTPPPSSGALECVVAGGSSQRPLGSLAERPWR
jgi:hypothetical protein